MMESVALTESHIIAEVNDFVMVEPEEEFMELGDDDSYDYCDDVMSEAADSISVCSDLPSIDPASFGLEPTEAEEKTEGRRPRVVSFGNEEDEAQSRSERFKASVESIDEVMSEEQGTPLVVDSAEEEATPMLEDSIEKVNPEEPKMTPMTTSRLSNKKRRKKMKEMKKAAAAKAAAAALSEMKRQAAAANADAMSPRKQKKSSSTTRVARSKKVPNLAVSCALQSHGAYKKELALSKKKGSSNFVSPL